MAATEAAVVVVEVASAIAATGMVLHLHLHLHLLYPHPPPGRVTLPASVLTGTEAASGAAGGEAEGAGGSATAVTGGLDLRDVPSVHGILQAGPHCQGLP